MKRGRGRGGRKPSNNLNRTMESNGPDVKVRGTAHQICDKYQALARDAHASGDRIAYENYLQHAEHYHRIIVAAQQAAQETAAAQGKESGDTAEGSESATTEAEDGNGGEAQRPRARRGRRTRSDRANGKSNGSAEDSDEKGAGKSSSGDKEAPAETA